MGIGKLKILYLSFYNLIINRYGLNNYITRKELHCELGKHFVVPKLLRDKVILECRSINILTKQDKKNYIILKNQDLLNEICNSF